MMRTTGWPEDYAFGEFGLRIWHAITSEIVAIMKAIVRKEFKAAKDLIEDRNKVEPDISVLRHLRCVITDI